MTFYKSITLYLLYSPVKHAWIPCSTNEIKGENLCQLNISQRFNILNIQGTQKSGTKFKGKKQPNLKRGCETEQITLEKRNKHDCKRPKDVFHILSHKENVS